MANWLRIVVASGLLGTCWAKILSGYNTSFSTPLEIYWLSALAECVLAGLILSRRWRIAAFATVLFAGAGVCLGILAPDDNCGCVGVAIPLDGRGRVVLASVLGLLASLVLVFSPKATSPLETLVDSRCVSS